MAKFIIQPHGRLQEWIAHEKGYFRDEGLDYEFLRGPSADTKKTVDPSGKVTDLMAGAFESYQSGGGNKGVKSDISCACHWTVNQAATQKIGTMWGKSYVVTPGGVMVPPESPITTPEQLAGQEIAVGYHSAATTPPSSRLSRSSPGNRSSFASAARSGRGSISASAATCRRSASGACRLEGKFFIAFFFMSFLFPTGGEGKKEKKPESARAGEKPGELPKKYQIKS